MATKMEIIVAPSGGDYTTLSDAIAHVKASHANLVTGDIYVEIKIQGDWSGGADTKELPTLNDLTTNPTHYIKIYTDSSNRAGTSWNTSKYIINPAPSAIDHTFSIISNDCVWIDGLQITNNTPSANGQHLIEQAGNMTNGANWLYVSNCLLKGHGNGSYSQAAVYQFENNGYGRAYVWNCAAWNFSGLYINYVSGAGNTMYCYNCVSIGNDMGFRGDGGTVNAKNCYAQNASTAGYYATINITNCASSDNSGSASPHLHQIPYSTATFVNVTAGSEDFALADTDSALYHAGTDTSGESAPLNFTTDINGETYPAGRSIGIDEIVASAVSVTPSPAILTGAGDQPAPTILGGANYSPAIISAAGELVEPTPATTQNLGVGSYRSTKVTMNW